MYKKAITSSLIIAAMVSALAGCNKKETQVNTLETTGTNNLTPITLTAFINSPPLPDKWKWGQDPSSQKITKDTGVTLDITYAATSDNTEINTLLAAGQKLPDFIVTNAHGPVARNLVQQGFVQPLNKLAEKYDPNFKKVMPTDMDKVYSAEDGNLYCVVDWYGDPSKYSDQILNSRGPVSFTIKKDIYEKYGSPQLETLDKYKDFLIKAKKDYQDIKHVIWDFSPNTPWTSQSLLNVFARMYGANNNFFKIDGDKIGMVFMQPSYKKALKTYNDFYKAGLINPETFVFKTEQKKAAYKAKDIISYVGYYWTLIEGMGDLTNVVYQTIDFPLPAETPRSQFKIHDDYFGIGGSRGTFISKDSKSPERAIKYISYMLGKDGQLLQRYGAEGVTWNSDEKGRPKENQTKRDAESKGVDVLQRDYGVYNYNFSWFTSNWILVYGAHNTYSAWPGMIQDFKVMTPYQQNERLADLVYATKSEDALVLRQQIFDLWAKKAAAIVLADSDEKFETEYQKFLDEAKKAGVSKLEEYFAKDLKYWKDRGIK
jgi:putative aldouronate transport system substrate-binding protein